MQVVWLFDYYDVIEQVNDQVVRLLTAEWLINMDDYGWSLGACSMFLTWPNL
jgi:hypothetical protein